MHPNSTRPHPSEQPVGLKVFQSFPPAEFITHDHRSVCTAFSTCVGDENAAEGLGSDNTLSSCPSQLCKRKTERRPKERDTQPDELSPASRSLSCRGCRVLGSLPASHRPLPSGSRLQPQATEPSDVLSSFTRSMGSTWHLKKPYACFQRPRSYFPVVTKSQK